MSTQRRVVRWQRLLSTEFAGTQISSSPDAEVAGSEQSFRRVANGLTASPSHFWNGRSELATNSLNSGSRCEWISRANQYRFSPLSRNGANGSSPAGLERPAGVLPKQLPFTSPLLSGAYELERRSAHIMQSALPQLPTGLCPGTERQHGQGNLYLQHAARNAACDSGRRSARGDLLRAGK